MLVFSDKTVQFFMQKHGFIPAPAVQGRLTSFSHIQQNTYMYALLPSQSLHIWGFEYVGKDQTAMNINPLQYSLQLSELVHLEPTHRTFRRAEAEPLEQPKMHIFNSNHHEHGYSWVCRHSGSNKKTGNCHRNAWEDLRPCPPGLWLTCSLASSLLCPEKHIIINSPDSTMDFAKKKRNEMLCQRSPWMHCLAGFASQRVAELALSAFQYRHWGLRKHFGNSKLSLAQLALRMVTQAEGLQSTSMASLEKQ